ncbi:GNAT family N-acetyltransferase [Paenibacillus sp. M1]|uniref:GNAT family N-acetyltransferase n=1 Tax=Paenibacillus haidiansis TaxID=1574488 RepID=A0ABU7VVG5_9BACL
MDYKMIEELALNNWPALTTLLYDGWVLRFAEGYTKRSNSVSPLYGSGSDLELKIGACEKIYAEQGIRIAFKITPFVQPEHLDAVLERKGYSLIDETSMQTLALDNLSEPRLKDVRITGEAGGEWLDAYARMGRLTPAQLATAQRMFANIKTKAGYMAQYHNGHIVSCGLGVVERDYIGLYGIMTDAEYRNRGFGEQMILNLLQWGKANGANHSYLAVVANNAPAQALYAKIGYKEVYRHWYRVKE